MPKSPPPPPGPRKRLLGSTLDWDASPGVPRPARDVPTQPQPVVDPPPTVRLAAKLGPAFPALKRSATQTGIGEGDRATPFTGDALSIEDLDAIPTPRSGTAGTLDLTFDVNRTSDPGLLLDLPSGDTSEALDLVVSRTGSSSIAPAEPSRAPDELAELRERYALGDFSGALTIAEGILEDDPDNADVQRYAESCRDVLMQMYAARLGAMDQIPTVALPPEQLKWLTLDHRAGFLLSHVDGVSSLEEILDISGMAHLEAMRIIYDLLQQKVIVLQ